MTHIVGNMYRCDTCLAAIEFKGTAPEWWDCGNNDKPDKCMECAKHTEPPELLAKCIATRLIRGD